MAEYEIDEVFFLKDGEFFAQGTLIDMQFKGDCIHYHIEELIEPISRKFFSAGYVFLKHIKIVSIASAVQEYPFLFTLEGDVVSCYSGQLNGTDIDSMDGVTVAHIRL